MTDTVTEDAATGPERSGDLLVERTERGVAIVTLNRPHRLNALTSPMLGEIYDTLETLGHDASCRVIIITGAGRGFCAGDDLVDYRPPDWVPTDVGTIHSNMYQQKHVAQLVPRMPSTGRRRAPATRWPWAPTCASPRRRRSSSTPS
jgi:enoyl-CoA hydratase/carnithine racemase